MRSSNPVLWLIGTLVGVGAFLLPLASVEAGGSTRAAAVEVRAEEDEKEEEADDDLIPPLQLGLLALVAGAGTGYLVKRRRRRQEAEVFGSYDPGAPSLN